MNLHDPLLKTLKKALEYGSILSNGSPLTAGQASQRYEMPVRDAQRGLDQLVKEGIARVVDGGYLLTEEGPL